MAYGRRINCPNGMIWINGECMNVTPPPPGGNTVRRHRHVGPTKGSPVASRRGTHWTMRGGGNLGQPTYAPCSSLDGYGRNCKY